MLTCSATTTNTAINKVASFFGDAVLHEMQLGVIVDDLFEESRSFDEEEELNYTDKIYKMSVHPLMIEFISGQGTARHGTVQ
jgi:antitoxin component YwqK of YwqJK toxin-antitoxin module